MRVPKPEYLAIGKRLVELREGRNLNQIQGAAALGIKNRTYQNYEYGFNQPNTGNLKKIVHYYGCSYTWLLNNEGDPFPKAGIPEPSAGAAYIKEGAAAYAAGAPAQQFNIMEDLDLAARVLGSSTHYAAALHLNIRSFSGAIAAESVISKYHEDLRKQGEQIEQLQINIKNMREEIKELKRMGGDSPPIALETDHAARTGTEDQAT